MFWQYLVLLNSASETLQLFTFSLRDICGQQESWTMMYPESESEKQGDSPLKDLDFMVPICLSCFFPETGHANVLLLISSKHTYHSLDLPRPNNMEALLQVKISNRHNSGRAFHPKVHNP